MMKYIDCIKKTMGIIEYLLENNWVVNIRGGNAMIVRLTDEGFILEPLNSEDNLEIKSSKMLISPSVLIGLLFCRMDDLSDQIPSYYFDKMVSYVELAKLTDRMRHNYYANSIKSSSVIDIDFARFKKVISKISKLEIGDLRNQVLGLAELDYKSLVNLRITDQVTARKIERMYQVEALLEKYCRTSILETTISVTDEIKQYFYDYLLAIMDLTKEEIDWEDFCALVQTANNKQRLEDNCNWSGRHCSNNPKITILGLDEMPLPGNPLKYGI